MPAAEEDPTLIVSLTNPNGDVITLGPVVARTVDGFEFINLWLTIEGAGLTAKTLVTTIEGGTGPYCLSQFAQELADDWKGELPDREFESIEHHFAIASSHDPLGHVLLRFTLRDTYLADAWEVRATAQVDAGEEMSAFARGVRDLLGNA